MGISLVMDATNLTLEDLTFLIAERGFVPYPPLIQIAMGRDFDAKVWLAVDIVIAT